MMDIPQVLGRICPTQDWGPMATTGKTYEEFAPMWRGTIPCPAKAEMENVWSQIEQDNAAKATIEAQEKSLLDKVENLQDLTAEERRLFLRKLKRRLFA